MPAISAADGVGNCSGPMTLSQETYRRRQFHSSAMTRRRV